MNELKQLLIERYARKSGDGKKVAKILKEYSLDEIFETLGELLQSIHKENFEGALFFINYVYRCGDYIPGRNEEYLTEKIRNSNLILDLVAYLERKKAYSRIEIVFLALKNLPADISKAKMEDYIKKYSTENPALLPRLFNSYMEFFDYAFPHEIYSNLHFANKDMEFFVKYCILQAEYMDNFERDEALKALASICPENYKDFLGKRIAENQKMLKEDFIDSADEEILEDIVVNRLCDYFALCDELYENGEYKSFEDFLGEIRESVE